MDHFNFIWGKKCYIPSINMNKKSEIALFRIINETNNWIIKHILDENGKSDRKVDIEIISGYYEIENIK